MLPGPDHLRVRHLRIPRLRGDPLRPLRRDPGPGHLGRPPLRVVQEADPRERLRAVHEGRDQAHPDGRRAPRALHPPPAPARHVRADERRPARNGRRKAGLADRPGPPPQHQSEPAHPGLAQDDELPRLARRHRGPRPPPAVQRRPQRGDPLRRRQPAPEPRIHGPVLPADRGDLPDRLGQPDRRRHPRPHPALDQRGPLELRRSEPGERLRRPGRGPRQHPPDPDPGPGGHPAPAVDGQQRPRRPDPALLHRTARVHQRGQEVRRPRGLLRPHGAHRLPAGQPRQARRQERRPVPGHPDPEAGRPPQQDHRHGQEAQDLVHHVRRPHRLHDPQQPRRRHRAEVQGHRGHPPGIPPPRPGLQELDVPARDRQGPVHGPGRLRRGPAHRPQLEPPRGPAGHGLRRQVQEPVPGQPGRQAAAPRGPARRRGRGLRLDLQPRPDPVPGRARPPRLLRGDGHHDPGGRRHPGRQVLLPRLRRRRLQPQRVPLVAADQAGGRPPPARPRPGDPGGRPRQRRLPGPRRPEPAEPPGQRLDRRGRPLFAQEDRRHRPRGEPLRHQGHPRAARRGRARVSRP